MNAVSALKAAVVAQLRADAGVAALVGPRIYDEVPSDSRGDQADAVAPWVYLGPVNLQRLEHGAAKAWVATMRLYCITLDPGRDSAWGLAGAVSLALDQTQPVLASGFTLIDEFKEIAAGDVIEPDRPKSVFLDIRVAIASTALYPGA
jgi:hypothetical protein